VTNGTRFVDWMTAFGTVGAVAVALILASIPAWRQRRRRPRLEILVGSEEPHLRPVHGGVSGRPGRGGFDIEEVRVRVEVHNFGRSEARRVRVQLLGWASQRTGNNEQNWIAYDIDPMSLMWVGAPASDGGQAFFADLAADMSDLVDVVTYSPRSGEVRLVLPGGREILFRPEANYTFVDYWVEIAVAAENADVVTCGFYFSTSKANGVDNVRTGDPPPGKNVLKGGYLSILARQYDEGRPSWWQRLRRRVGADRDDPSEEDESTSASP
jgi:hypothetical protein